MASRSRFGIQLHTGWPLNDYPRLAQTIEGLGFGELTVHDVLFRRPVWPVLTLIAEHTRDVLVGPDVTNPFARHPVVTAANIAAIDELSSGRAILGVGQGSFFDAAHIDHTRAVAAVREMTLVVRQLLAGEQGSFEGEVFRLDADAALRFKGPRPAIPIFAGAFGPKMIEMAAGLMDEIRPPGQWDPAYLAVVQEHVGIGARRAGREPAEVELAVDVWAFASANRASAEAMAARQVPRFLTYMRPLTEFYGVETTERALATFAAIGDVAELIDGCERLFAAGAKRITFSGALGPEVGEALAILGQVRRHFE